MRCLQPPMATNRKRTKARGNKRENVVEKGQKRTFIILYVTLEWIINNLLPFACSLRGIPCAHSAHPMIYWYVLMVIVVHTVSPFGSIGDLIRRQRREWSNHAQRRRKWIRRFNRYEHTDERVSKCGRMWMWLHKAHTYCVRISLCRKIFVIIIWMRLYFINSFYNFRVSFKKYKLIFTLLFCQQKTSRVYHNIDHSHEFGVLGEDVDVEAEEGDTPSLQKDTIRLMCAKFIFCHFFSLQLCTYSHKYFSAPS